MNKKITDEPIEATERIYVSVSKNLAHKVSDYSANYGVTKGSVVNLALAEFFRTRDLQEQGLAMLVELIKDNPELLSDSSNKKNKRG